jgi:NIMA (never in mitosis gene a)-related kinase
LLASIEDDYIVAYKEAFIDEESQTLCIVMELLQGGDVLKKITSAIKYNEYPFTEKDIWRALVHMTKGLKALHELNIVHRDLKCANIFLSLDGKFKLGDLNVSKIAKKGLVYT